MGQRCEEAHREAKEIHDGAIRNAEKILEKVRGDLEAIEAREAALKEETNSKRQELQALEGDVAAREQAISVREEKAVEHEESVCVHEEDAGVRERELENITLKQSAEHDHLEVLERWWLPLRPLMTHVLPRPMPSSTRGRRGRRRRLTSCSGLAARCTWRITTRSSRPRRTASSTSRES
jgi:hypothetical protein